MHFGLEKISKPVIRKNPSLFVMFFQLLPPPSSSSSLPPPPPIYCSLPLPQPLPNFHSTPPPPPSLFPSQMLSGIEVNNFTHARSGDIGGSSSIRRSSVFARAQSRCIAFPPFSAASEFRRRLTQRGWQARETSSFRHADLWISLIKSYQLENPLEPKLDNFLEIYSHQSGL